MADGAPSPQPCTAILVVDDDQGLSRLVEKALQREGFETAAASSFQEAVGWLEKQQPALMLLDLKLGTTEGKELIEHLAAHGRSVPFIIITGQGDERSAVDMMKRGALDYLVKDVDFLQFVPEVVRRALGRLERERKLAAAEEALRRSESNLAKAQREILQISEMEQRRIGQDLHDGLCQHLAATELMSEILEQKLARKSKKDAARVAEIARQVREAISQTRLLARGLSPVVLESEGLMSALEELADFSGRMFRVKAEFKCDAPVLVHDHTAATHLYRIAQEAVSNAVRHGKAKRIVISLKRTDSQVTLRIKDFGVGLPGDVGKAKGMGLRIMQYRAAMISGSLMVQTDTEGGTSVTCTFPSEASSPTGSAHDDSKETEES